MEDVLRVGAATGTQEKAEALVESLRRRVATVESRAALASRKPRVACLEWLDPVMYAGHWVPQMVELAGGEDCLGTRHAPSQRVDWPTVVEKQPDIVLVLPCGFNVQQGLREVHLLTERDGWAELPAAREERIYVVDASAYYSRSGPRLVHGLEMMAEMLHPELFSGFVPTDGAIRLYGEVFKLS